MNIVVMNLTCASFPVCHCSCSRAEGRFLVPYRFFSHFLTVGLSEMEMNYLNNPFKTKIRFS